MAATTLKFGNNYILETVRPEPGMEAEMPNFNPEEIRLAQAKGFTGLAGHLIPDFLQKNYAATPGAGANYGMTQAAFEKAVTQLETALEGPDRWLGIGPRGQNHQYPMPAELRQLMENLYPEDFKGGVSDAALRQWQVKTAGQVRGDGVVGEDNARLVLTHLGDKVKKIAD